MTKTKQTIIINGRRFDAATGLPMSATPKPVQRPAAKKKLVVIKDIAAPQAKPRTSSARTAAPHIKNSVQKSMTLRRSALKKPSGRRPTRPQRASKKIERSPHISRFAPSQVAVQNETHPKPVDHELAWQAEALQAVHANHLKKQAEIHNKPAISSRTIKEHLLKQQLENAPDSLHAEIRQAGAMSRRARFMSVATTSFALVLLGGYLTYINIPNLSIRVAAANAGIDASLPRYQPSGYRLHGPITYTDGQVSVSYQQSAGSQGYRIIQKSSDWDPQATLDNYVEPMSGGNYQIHSSQGLTVYTYDNKAAWVNGGILHVIEANMPLSGQTVERIAVSM